MPAGTRFRGHGERRAGLLRPVQQTAQLESPFSGNLVDICPTGVFTDKTARFRARYWDYDMAPSVCPHCSLGCNTMPAARYRELLKIIARRNDAVNGWFICDRGRFSDSGGQRSAAAAPAVGGRERVDWDEALEALLLRISEVEDAYGAGSMAIVGSSRLALEAAALLPLLGSCTAAGALCYFIDEAGGCRGAGGGVAARNPARGFHG